MSLHWSSRSSLLSPLLTPVAFLLPLEEETPAEESLGEDVRGSFRKKDIDLALNLEYMEVEADGGAMPPSSPPPPLLQAVLLLPQAPLPVVHVSVSGRDDEQDVGSC